MYPITSTPTYLVDQEHLGFLVDRLNAPNTKAIIVGFGEYAKHLVNYNKSAVAGICDPRPEMHGVRFRDIPVVALEDEVNGVNAILVAEYTLLSDYLPKVVEKFPGADLVIPPRMHYKASNDVNVFEQDELYKYLNKHKDDAPPTMMIIEKIRFLLELLQFGLTKPGCVVEMGSWQGGSTWYMAKTLAFLNQTRRLYMMDLFEDHMMDPTATMCSEEIRRRMSVYDHVEMIQGLVDDPSCLSKIKDEQICFAHMDLGPQPVALDYLWEHLSPGAPLLLDNYGHIQAPPWAFDRYIEKKGCRIIRFPWSEQGLTFKTC